MRFLLPSFFFCARVIGKDETFELLINQYARVEQLYTLYVALSLSSLQFFLIRGFANLCFFFSSSDCQGKSIIQCAVLFFVYSLFLCARN